MKLVEFSEFECPYCARHVMETEPQVRDGQTTTVSFAISPLPATLKVTCNVMGAVIQINDQPSTVSNSLPVPSLQPLSVTVSATGYVAQVVKLGPMEPGKAYRQEVKLEPVSVAAVPTGEPGKPMTVDLGGAVQPESVQLLLDSQGAFSVLLLLSKVTLFGIFSTILSPLRVTLTPVPFILSRSLAS